MALLKQFFVGFIIAFLCVPVAAAQSMEEEQGSLASEIRSYSALNKAIYWQRMGDQTPHTDEGKRRENYENASEELEVAIQSDPQSSFLFAKMAEVSFSLQNLRRAMSACRKALKLNPDNADAHFWLGRIELVRQREQDAISAFEKATEINPEHLTAQRYLSSLLFNRNDFEGAARSYAAVVKNFTLLRSFRRALS